MAKKLLLGIAILIGMAVCVFAGIQVIPYGHNHTNPPVVQEPAWNAPETRALAKRACFDCHSNETVWPAYSNVAPVSWLIQHDVEEGRQNLNFSEWSGQMEADEVGEVILGGEMPPAIYRLQHPTATLSDAEKQQLADGLVSSLK